MCVSQTGPFERKAQEIHTARNFPIFHITERKLRVCRIAWLSSREYRRRVIHSPTNDEERGSPRGKESTPLYETRVISTCATYTWEEVGLYRSEPMTIATLNI